MVSSSITASAGGQVDPVEVRTAVNQLKQSSPYLFRSSRQDRGIGLEGVPQAPPMTDEQKARMLFGKGSDARKGMALIKSDRAEYARLKVVARQLEII